MVDRHAVPMRRSIGFRMIAAFLVLQMLGVLIFGIVTCVLYRQSMRNDKIQTLERRSDRVLAILEHSANDPDETVERRFADIAGVSGESPYIQVRALDGTLIYPARPRLKDDLSAIPPGGLQRTLRSFRVGGQEYLVDARPVVFRGQTLELLVGGSLADGERRMWIFAVDVCIAAIALLCLTGGLGFFISDKLLRPIAELTTATHRLDPASLSSRLPVPSTNDELQHLAEAWNDLLNRLETAIVELRQFTADTSHELRSPLALIRMTAEYSLRHSSPTGEIENGLRQIVDECTDATRLLTNLLALARAEHSRDCGSREDVDLSQLLQEAGQRALTLTGPRGQTLVVSTPSEAVIARDADEAQLRQVIAILLDNAIRYTQPTGLISLACRMEEEDAVILVSDTGRGIPAADLPHIFDRFFRGEKTQSTAAETPGSGLGLAIAKRFITNHGGTIVAESEPLRGTEITIRLRAAGQTGTPARRTSGKP